MTDLPALKHLYIKIIAPITESDAEGCKLRAYWDHSAHFSKESNLAKFLFDVDRLQ